VQQLLAELHAEPPAKGQHEEDRGADLGDLDNGRLAAFLNHGISRNDKGAVLSKIRELCKSTVAMKSVG
jgi:hypothetical protein